MIFFALHDNDTHGKAKANFHNGSRILFIVKEKESPLLIAICGLSVMYIAQMYYF